MRQLSGLDTTFLNIETPTTYGHVSGLAIFDPAEAEHPATLEDVKNLIRERIHLLPPYRRRLVEVPFGLDQPYWIEDPDFDLDFHIRQLALPPPGNRHQLADQVARIVARPLDRSRPLWELYLIDGLEGGLSAQLTKIHHCAIDGVSGAEILGNLLDIEPTPRAVQQPETTWTPDEEPSQVEMFMRGMLAVAATPRKGIRLGLKSMRHLPELAESMGFGPLPGTDTINRLTGRRKAEMLSRAPTKPPRTSFNGRISAHRRFAFESFELARVKAVKSTFGVTVNDVIMAMCAGTLRRYLDAHDELPEASLVAMVPVSVRTEEQSGTYGNQVASMTASLHTDIEDPIERLAAIHESMRVAKEKHQALPAEILQDFAQFTAPAIAARASRVIARAAVAELVDLPFNVVISNVPGPQFPLYGIGAKLIANYPVSAINDGVGLNMTVQSYNGSLDFGFVACRELVPDLWELIDHLGDSLEALESAAESRG